MFLAGPGEMRTQRLDDGSLLVLTRVQFGRTNVFPHGSRLEKFLGNAIPSNGLHLAHFKLERPDKQPSFAMPDKTWLTAEFQLVSSNISRIYPPNLRSYRQFRCFVSGESGLGYVEEFWPGGFENYRDGCFAYILSSRFPRDAKSLSFRIEQRMAQDAPWRAIGNFRIRNPSQPAHQRWSAEAIPAVKTFNGLKFVLAGLTRETQRLDESDIGNNGVSLLLRVQTNAVTLTNWSAADLEAEDASGNWEQGLRGLDSRFVWKLEVDFCPASDFSPESLFHFEVPVSLPQPILMNFAGVPLEISWVNGDMLAVETLTNRLDLRLLFVAANDREGRNLDGTSGSWNQYRFWRTLRLNGTTQSVEATIAIVPNVHVTYFVQPKLIRDAEQTNAAHF